MENLALSVLCYNNVVSFQFLGNYSFDMYHLIQCEKKICITRLLHLLNCSVFELKFMFVFDTSPFFFFCLLFRDTKIVRTWQRT